MFFSRNDIEENSGVGSGISVVGWSDLAGLLIANGIVCREHDAMMSTNRVIRYFFIPMFLLSSVLYSSDVKS